MEERKAYKFDLEHKRSKRLLIGFISSTALLVAILQIRVPTKLSGWKVSTSVEPKEVMAPITMQQPMQHADIPASVAATYSDQLPSNDEYSKLADANKNYNDKDAADNGQTVVFTSSFSVEFNQYGDGSETVRQHEQEATFYLPAFPGGEIGLLNFIRRNVRYPQAAEDAGIEGRVVVQFDVNKDGSVSNAEVVRGVSPILDSEALRVVRMMPRWHPALQGGHPVKMSYAVPVVFKLGN
jgi:periplasmic protein TonB